MKFSLQKKYLLIILALLFLFSLIISKYCLTGEYNIMVFGFRWALAFDPAGWYFPSGFYFFRTEKLAYFGHPGMILQLIMGMIGEISYKLLLPHGGVPYNVFLIKNFPLLVFLNKQAIALIFILAVYLLYKITQLTLKDENAALFASVGFITSLPFLLSLDRISPDAICVTLILAASYFLLKKYKPQNKTLKNLQYLIFSGICASSAIFSKLYYGLPAAMALCLYILISNQEHDGIAARIKNLAVYASTIILVAFIWFQKLDLEQYIASWMLVVNEHGTRGNIRLKNFLIHPNKFDVLIVCELVFFIISIIGVVYLYKNKFHRQNKHIQLLFLIIISLLPVIIYRCGFHHLLIFSAVASIPFTVIIMKWIEQGNYNFSAHKYIWVGFAVIGIIHFTSIYASALSNVTSHESYLRKAKPVYTALESIDYGEKIAVDGSIRVITPILGLNYFNTEEMIEGVKAVFDFEVPRDAITDSNIKFYIERDEDGFIVTPVNP